MQRDYLIGLRQQRNESQQDVAKAIGITRQYYNLIENGTRQKKMDVMLITSIANHFGIPVAEVVSLEQSICNGSSEMDVDIRTSAQSSA